jgi:hypothetical protein
VGIHLDGEERIADSLVPIIHFLQLKVVEPQATATAAAHVYHHSFNAECRQLRSTRRTNHIVASLPFASAKVNRLSMC